MTRGASEKLKRSLAMATWVATQPAPVPVDDVCRRFGYEPQELETELNELFFCGIHPFTPDVLVEAGTLDGEVFIRFPYGFNRPLRPTTAETLALLAATYAWLAEPGADRSGPLATGAEKLARSAAGGDEAVAVELEPTKDDVLEVLRQAEAERRVVALEYYSYGRDEVTSRSVEVYLVHNTDGHWYATGLSREIGEMRRFRVDRVASAALTADRFEPPAALPAAEAFSPGEGDQKVALKVPRDRRWVAERFPVEVAAEQTDGSADLLVRASAGPWLDRLLLQLGPEVGVAPDVEDQRRAAAQRILARYQ